MVAKDLAALDLQENTVMDRMDENNSCSRSQIIRIRFGCILLLKT